MLINLVGNVIKFMECGGVMLLLLGVFGDGGCVVFWVVVCDMGIGIDVCVWERLF